MYRFNVKKPIYPLLGVAISLLTLFFGLFTARIENIYIFYIVLYFLYLCFGYYKACLGVLPVTFLLIALFAGSTYFITYDINNVIVSINRSLAVSFALIPGLALSSTYFIRSLQQAKMPKIITLGMMIAVNFFPLFLKEMKQIRNAMKTRGVTSLLHPAAFYRAFLVPLVVRIVNISDTLSVSVETRGFTSEKCLTTIYEPMKFVWTDILFFVLFLSNAVLSALMFTVIL